MENKPTKALFIIDPQNDFTLEGAPLQVPGAIEDLERLTKLIKKDPTAFESIFISKDLHVRNQIFHKAFWRVPSGKPPEDFTTITLEDLASGAIRPAREADDAWAEQYVRTLAEQKRDVLTIWPDHCLKGSTGREVYAPLKAAIEGWELATGRKATVFDKGYHPLTESYGALQAEVPVPGAPETELNVPVLNALMRHDEIVVAGEASSHCVQVTVEQILANTPGAQHGKLTLLTDAMSAIQLGDYPAKTAQWFREKRAQGLTLATTGIRLEKDVQSFASLGR